MRTRSMVKAIKTEVVVSSWRVKPWKCATNERTNIQMETVRPIGKL